MAIKKTLLEIVQEILDALDSEEVNSISDSVEAQQIASFVENTFYNIIATRDVPAHEELLKLTALSDSAYPTHFTLPDNVRSVKTIWYDTSDDSSFEYEKIIFLEPEEFLKRTDGLTENYTTVSDKNGGTKLRIQNDKMPEFYTTFDDQYVVMDSHDSSIDTTLKQSKIRCMGSVYPVFDRTDDTYVPDIPPQYFQYLINETKSFAFDVLKGGVSQKVEQAARRQKVQIQNDRHRIERPKAWSIYGR